MLHFGNKSTNCKSCVPFKGFKFIGIVLVGCIIGSIALSFVEQPPSAKLIAQSRHNKDTGVIISKLDTMERNIVSIKNDLLDIKRRLNKE